MNTGWNNCGCGTTYLDAYGNRVNGPGSGSDGNFASGCGPDWGLLALAGVAAVAGCLLANRKGK